MLGMKTYRRIQRIADLISHNFENYDVARPQETSIIDVITVKRNLPLVQLIIFSYLGKFFHLRSILPCRCRYTIHEYWSSWHCCHIQEEKHCTRPCLEKQKYWSSTRIYRRLLANKIKSNNNNKVIIMKIFNLVRSPLKTV